MEKIRNLASNFSSAAVLPPPITGKKKTRDSADLTDSLNSLELDEGSGLPMSFGNIDLGQKKQQVDNSVLLQESDMLEEIDSLLRKYGTDGFPETIVGKQEFHGEGELNIFAQWLRSMGYGDIGERKNEKGGANVEFNIRYLANEVNRGTTSLEELIQDMFRLAEGGTNYETFRGDVIIALLKTLQEKRPVYSEDIMDEDKGGRKKSRRNQKKKKSRKARKTRRCKKKYKKEKVI